MICEFEKGALRDALREVRAQTRFISVLIKNKRRLT
jgi:hypothetical protein